MNYGGADMWSHAERFLIDLRQARSWVTGIAVVAFATSAIATYMTWFFVATARQGALSAVAPRDPLGFIRVIDPQASVEAGGAEGSALDQPGMRVLRDRLAADPRLFVSVPLQALTTDRARFPETVQDGVAVIGIRPPFLPDSIEMSTGAMLWGSIAGQIPEVDDAHLADVPIRQVSAHRLRATFVSGGGRLTHTEDAALVVLDPGTAHHLGIHFPYTVADIAENVTCYCSPADLTSLTVEMTTAERRAGTGRSYWATGYAGVMGPAERSWAAAQLLETGIPLAILLAAAALAIAASRVMWARRVGAYRVEWLCGAEEVGLQIRQQLLLALSLTVPAVLGFVSLDALLRLTDAVIPWPLAGGPLLVVGALLGQAAIGAVAARRVRRLYAAAHNGGSR